MKTIRTRRTITQPVPDRKKQMFVLIVPGTGEVAESSSIVPLIDIAARALADGHAIQMHPPSFASRDVFPVRRRGLMDHPDVKGVHATGTVVGQ